VNQQEVTRNSCKIKWSRYTDPTSCEGNVWCPIHKSKFREFLKNGWWHI